MGMEENGFYYNHGINQGADEKMRLKNYDISNKSLDPHAF